MRRVEAPSFGPRVPDVPDPRRHREPYRRLLLTLPTPLKQSAWNALEVWYFGGLTPPKSQTEQAKAEFLRRVIKLTGVLRVERNSDKLIAEQTFRVFVGEADIDAEYRVYDLKGELYRRFPKAHLDVEVFEDTVSTVADPGAPH